MSLPVSAVALCFTAVGLVGTGTRSDVMARDGGSMGVWNEVEANLRCFLASF